MSGGLIVAMFLTWAIPMAGVHLAHALSRVLVLDASLIYVVALVAERMYDWGDESGKTTWPCSTG